MKLKKGFDYEKNYMGLPAGDSLNGAFDPGSKHEFRLKSLINNLSEKKGKILDVGCGAGGFINSLKHHYPGFDCSGCDISRSAIIFAQKNFGDRIDFKLIKKGRLPYPSHDFDVVILIHVFEHVEDKKTLLKEIHRVLKKGGIFHLQVPCEADPFTFTRFGWGRKLTRKYWGHLAPLTDSEVIAYLKKAGFVPIGKSYDSHLLSQLLMLIFYFLPKVFLDFLLGEKKALAYTDARFKARKGKKLTPLFYIRKVWTTLSFWLTFLVRCLESMILSSSRFTALNLQLTVRKKDS